MKWVSDKCDSCGGDGRPGGCGECGLSREKTDEELDRDFEDARRAEAAVTCRVYQRHPNVVCSLGTKGCPLYHGR